jgi:hypothetical protein
MQVGSLVECIKLADRNYWVDGFGMEHYGETGELGGIYTVEAFDKRGDLLLAELNTPYLWWFGKFVKGPVKKSRFRELQPPISISIYEIISQTV